MILKLNLAADSKINDSGKPQWKIPLDYKIYENNLAFRRNQRKKV